MNFLPIDWQKNLLTFFVTYLLLGVLASVLDTDVDDVSIVVSFNILIVELLVVDVDAPDVIDDAGLNVVDLVVVLVFVSVIGVFVEDIGAVVGSVVVSV